MTLWSRSRKELTKYFPDLVAAAEPQLPEGCILDGEAVIWNKDRLDFDALQRRMVTAKAVLPALARGYLHHLRPLTCWLLPARTRELFLSPAVGLCWKNWAGIGLRR